MGKDSDLDLDLSFHSVRKPLQHMIPLQNLFRSRILGALPSARYSSSHNPQILHPQHFPQDSHLFRQSPETVDKFFSQKLQKINVQDDLFSKDSRINPQWFTKDVYGTPISKHDPRYDESGKPNAQAPENPSSFIWELADGFQMIVVATGFPAHLKAKGRVFKKSVTVVAGNGNGIGGYAHVNGSGSLQHLLYAAFRKAKRRAVPIPRYDQRTIFHNKMIKYVSTKLYMWSRPKGAGVVAPNYLKATCALLGIQDITIKIHGSRNENNVLHAFFKGLLETSSFDDIARSTGKNIIHTEKTLRRGRLAMYY